MNKYLEQHLKKYPKMQIEDKIKLLMQAYLGNGHLVKDYNIVLERIVAEHETLDKLDIKYDLIEPVGDNYSRIYLKPYFDIYHSFDNLIEIFMKSATEEKNVPEFLKELEELRKEINEEEAKYLDEYIYKGNYLISHSKIYRELYHPHYLIVHNKYLK